MSKQKIKLTKLKCATVVSDDGDTVNVTQLPEGYDIEMVDDGSIVRVSNAQWKAVKKAIKALKGKKSKRVKEEEDEAVEETPTADAQAQADKSK